MVSFSFLAIVFFLYVASSYARNNIVDVQAICKQAQDPSFCFTFLKSRPGGPGKDLGDLESYTLGVLRTNVSNTITLITKLIAQSGSDLKKQNHYKTCLDQFGDEEGALGFVKRAQQDLENSDYISLNLDAGAVIDRVDDCLSNDNIPIKDTSLLPTNASVVKNIAEIIVNISSTRPFFLLHFLKSRPGGPGKDLGDLESYTLGVLRTNVSNTITLITKLITQSGSDLKKQNHYKICLQYLGDEGALGFVKRAQQDLENSDYISVNLNAAAVSDFADDCLSDDNIPIKDTSLLPKNASVIKNIAENIAIISNMLM
ncbi:hypothetical protein P8452_14549 [Trifolium repens]|nr:hypothetical protein P8452_14549 [Trifolium repens]